MAFRKVERQKAKLRMALTGVSGAGKTLGALYIAYGMTGDWGKIALMDTEHGRARFYAERSDLGTGEFLYSELTPPFSPERYIQMAREGANAVGPDGVLIVDSLSHAWNGEGGVLEIKDNIAANMRGNSYTAWNEAGKQQAALINALFALPCHTIVTMRSKMQYALQVNDKGKQEPVKLGLAPIQRDETEYEFDIVLNVSREHIATASKDVTFLDSIGETITPALGTQIAEWLNNGVEPEKCECCGATITASNGKCVADIVDGTIKNAGRKMCMTCFSRWFTLQKGRMAQINAIYAEAGYPAENHDTMIEAVLAQNGVKYAADANDAQYQQILRDMKGE